jgi:hypothetical protein
MSEVVFQMIALRLEHIMVFIFRLPPTAARLNHQRHGLLIEEMACDKSIVVVECQVLING